MIEAMASMVMEKRKKAIRLDTLASNIPAQHLYEKLGFAYRGVVAVLFSFLLKLRL